MIGKINVEFSSYKTDENGQAEISFLVSGESKYAAKQLLADIKKAKDKLVLSLDHYKSRRSVDQNRLLWALLEIMANSQNGGRTGGITAWDCYIDMLEKYGAKFEYILCLPEAFKNLKEIYRAVKEIETRDYNGVEMLVCKCFYGSSKFDTKEMTNLIDGIFDELATMEVKDDKEVRYWYDEWTR